MDGISRGMEVSHDEAPFLAGLLMAHCWALDSLGFSAITSLVASLGADVNSDLHLSLFQACINRVMVFCCQVSSTRGTVSDEQAVN